MPVESENVEKVEGNSLVLFFMGLTSVDMNASRSMRSYLRALIVDRRREVDLMK
jgi:hypothetical protein